MTLEEKLPRGPKKYPMTLENNWPRGSQKVAHDSKNVIFLPIFLAGPMGPYSPGMGQPLPSSKCMERALKYDAKAEYLQKSYLIGSHTVANSTSVMATMTVHIFPTYAYGDQRRYM